MSKLLIEEYPLMVLPSLACKIGLNEAIVLQQVHYWLQRSTTTADGHRWVYNSLEQWKAQFPFWSTDTVRRTIANLKERGLLVAECLSGNRFDRTPYYRINSETLAALECGSLQSSVASVDCKLQSSKTQKSADVRGKLQESDDGNLQPSDDGKLPSTLDKTETIQETTSETTSGLQGEASEAVDDCVAPQAASDDDAIQSGLFAEDHNPGEQQTGVKTQAEIIGEIFSYWQERMSKPRAKLDDKRRRAIRKAMEWGYAPRDLCRAIQGCSLTPHNMGQNERGEKYDGLELILRNADQIDRFMANASAPPVSTVGMSKSALVTAANAGLGARLAAKFGEQPESDGVGNIAGYTKGGWPIGRDGLPLSKAEVTAMKNDAAAAEFVARMHEKHGTPGDAPAAGDVIDMGAVEEVAREPAEAVAEIVAAEVSTEPAGPVMSDEERAAARSTEFAKMRQTLGYGPRSSESLATA
ncbi:hypothetical protein [Paraburkholderia sp. GAS32]|uniref:hypothetical protein n=1 Tax=Paraburkholderia sp. GAS32 TaxID=3035129 RepID=UPI003D24EB37